MFNRLILTDSLYADLILTVFICLFNRLILTDSLYADLYV